MKTILQFIIVLILSVCSVSTIQSQNVVTIGSATTSTYYSPINMYYNYSWNRLLYVSSEIGNTTNSAKITKIAFQYANSNPITITNQTCYLEATSASALSAGYINPTLSGATQVWTGSLNCSQGWVEITLSTPFILPSGSNLMIHWHNNQGSFQGSSYTWNYTATSNKVVHAYNDNGFPSGSSGTVGTFRPNIRLTWTVSTRTAAVQSITQPSNDFVNYGINLPASVRLNNPGKDTITSCRINWSINGVLQTPVYSYIPLIEEDTAIPVNIGNYTPVPNMVNRIKVWVDNALPYDSIRNDDTLFKDFYVCTNGLLGVYTIGGISDSFISISAAMEALLNCGVAGNVTFLLRSRTYLEPFSFTDTIQGLTSADKVTFASAAGNADSVIIVSLTDPPLLLSNTMNLVFSNITFDGSNGPLNTVKFEENVTGVEIRHCNIKSDPTVTSSTFAAVYYSNIANSGKKLYDLKLIANTIDGGYYNIYLNYPGNISTNSMITIDSNMLINAYYYGMYSSYYGYFPSISYNTFMSRFTDNGTGWYGMVLYNYNSADSILGNKIQSINKNISTVYGMYLGNYLNYNNYGTSNDMIVANNEIMLYTTSSSPGIYAIYPYSTKLKLLHNSVYMYGTGNAYGMYVYNYNTSDHITVMGNNLITDAGSSSYPILGYYCTAPYITLDYNNYYSTGSYIAYANANISTMAAMRSATGQDLNSISILPVFKNLSASLHTNGQSMLIARNPAVLYDLDKTPRLPLTNIGCYQDFYNGYNNATPTVLISPIDGVSSGYSSNVTITLKNMGQNRLDSVRIHWKINGGVENVYNWTGSLIFNTSSNVTLGTMIPIAGYNNILIYTSHPNGQSDDDVHNDTLIATIYSCDSALKGTYTIGIGGSFVSASDAMKAITLCGLSGPVVFKFKTGFYGNLSIPNAISGASTVNTVTFISEANHADSVIIGSSNNIPLYINNASYLRFKYLTFNGSAGAINAIKFENNVSNIDIKYCHIKSDPTTTSSTYAAVYYANISNSGKRMYNVNFIGNRIDGGYYNMYLYFMGSSDSYLGKVTIDSNIFTNAYYYGIFSYYYGYYPSISYNTFTSRSSNSSNYWYGMYMYVYNSADTIQGNKIQSTNPAIYYPCGMYLGYYLNYNNLGTPNDMIIANNEIILNISSGNYGMYIYYPYSSKVKLLHNSIYLYGSGAAYGMYLFNSSSSYKITAQRNNIVTNAGSAAYPIYLGSYYNSSYLILDYNNYYSTGNYVGYAGANISTIQAMRLATGQDAHSVSVNPPFKNPLLTLRLNDSTGITCPKVSNVPKDIRGKVRNNTTVMGSYERDIFEIQVASFISPLNGAKACSQDSMNVTVRLRNVGEGDLNMALKPISLHLRVNGGFTYQKDTLIAIGNLNEGQSIDITLSKAMFLNGIGNCNLKVYLTSIDLQKSNDTLTSSIYLYPIHTYDTLTLCANQIPYTYGDSLLFTPGTRNILFNSVNGCDSTVTLTLFVNPVYTRFDTLTICANQLPYTYGDSTFITAGNFSVHFKTIKGCDSLVILKLYVNPTFFRRDTITICASQLPYSYGDSIFTIAGSYNVHFKTIKGCDSLTTLRLYVNPIYNHRDTISICNNQLPYSYGDSVFILAGSYNVHFKTIKGCDSLVVLKLYVNPIYNHADTLTICQNQLPYNYGGNSLTAAGNYNIHFTSVKGCDSLVALRLYVNPTYSGRDTLTICSNQLPYHYGDSLFTAAGSFNVHFKTVKGCDSLVILRLYVNLSYAKTDTVSICSNQLPYRYGDSIFTVAGSYNVHFKTIKGCDSLIVLKLYVNLIYNKNDTLTICQNQLPYNYGGNSLLAAGSYNIHFTSVKGCDSLVVLRLYVNPTYNRRDTITLCSNQLPFAYGDSVLTTAGSFNVHFKTVKGCDSLIILRLYVNISYAKTDTVTLCSSQLPYRYGDSIFTLAGNYNVHFKTIKGCDSLVVLKLYVNTTYNRNDTLTICQNQLPYNYGGNSLTAAGNYNIHFTSVKGCDSLVSLRLYVNPTYSGRDTLTICASQLPYHYGDSLFTAAGSFNVHFKTVKGCDSLIVTKLYVNPSYISKDTVTICASQLPYRYGDSTLLFSGSHQITFTALNGCDSVVTLQLYVNPTYTMRDTVTICDSNYSRAGNYMVLLSTIKGCDSLVILTVKVNLSYTVKDTISICQNELPYTFAGNTLTSAGNYNIHLTTVKGCDSLIRLTLMVHPLYTNTDTLHLSATQFPFIYGDSIFNQQGNYNVHFKSLYGCDSLIRLTLIENINAYNHQDSITLCSNEFPLSYGDSLIMAGGIYKVVFKSIEGLDSTITLTINVNQAYTFTDSLSLCDNEFPYTYGDSVFTNGGVYSLMYTTIEGCDSIITLTINVNSSYSEIDTLTICDNELPYTYGDSIFTQEGDYVVYFHSILGCDSIVSLRLNVVNGVPSAPLQVYGDTVVTTAGGYTYYVDPVITADYYVWTISNTNWIGSSTTEMINIAIPNAGSGTISVKAVNICGESDTTSLRVRSTVNIPEMDGTKCVLGQNIPNPTSVTAKIPYAIPQDGKVVFNVMSINGQVLYREAIQASAGTHYLELNTELLSAGIYFYTMEYQGQRLVKKMTIQK